MKTLSAIPADQLRASLVAARTDFSADNNLETPLLELCSALWYHAVERIVAGHDTDGQRAVIAAREKLYDDGIGAIYGSGLDGAAEYIRFTFAAVVAAVAAS